MSHWVILEKILCYLKGAPRRGLLVDPNVECFTNTTMPGARMIGNLLQDIASWAEISSLGDLRNKMCVVTRLVVEA